MKFECGDLERALAISELMPEAREHLKLCPACRREYRVWNDLSAAAKELHEDWDTPALWPNIKKAIEAEPKPKPKPVWWREWKTLAVAATVLMGVVLLSRPWQWMSSPSPHTDTQLAAPLSSSSDFLTEQALSEVERSETAYRQSIEKLSQIAEPRLKHSASAVAVNCREKLLTLDSAIAETRTNLAQNRFNVHLQRALADLYREKKQTLEELLTRDQKN
ncbi:MAG: hypothetical protein ACR2IV_04585 [Bryobacteraceae bacterium]